MIACLRFNASRLKSNRAFAHSTGRVPGRTITIAEIREKLPSGRFTDDELDNHVEALELFGSGFVSRPAGSAAYLQLNYSVMRDLARYLAVEKVGLGLVSCSVVIETWWSRKHHGWLMFVFNFLCVAHTLTHVFALVQMVETKCGEECARLFRLVRTKRYLEQKKVGPVWLSEFVVVCLVVVPKDQ